MTLNDALHWRYSTKSFDPTKKISAADFAQLQEVLQFSPSSINLQPWHFVIADDDAGKARIAKGAEAENYRYNAAKITNASHVIVVCAKVIADEAHLQAVLDQEEADGRFATPENKVQRNGVCNLFLNFHRYDLKDEPHWHARQAYINLGALLLGAGLLGIDAVPMEGVDCAALDQEFDLRNKGYSALMVVALGYRAADDFNAKLPKSRLPQSTIISKA